MDALDLVEHIKSIISTPKVRDRQIKIGPSSLGSECGYCVAKSMEMRLRGTEGPQQNFSLYPWLGTAVHFYLEHIVKEATHFDFEYEAKLYVGTIKGWGDNPDYGEIDGNIDLYSREHATVLDYKILSKGARAKYLRSGLSTAYEYQSQMYGLAHHLIGDPVEQVCVLMIPRDSGRLSDIKPVIQPFDPEKGYAALRRAERIWNEFVIPNKIDELDTSDDCFNYHIQERITSVKLPASFTK